MTTVEAPATDVRVPPAFGARRVHLLAGGMALGAGVLWWLTAGAGVGSPLVRGVSPTIVGVLVILAELCTVNVYFRRETHSVSLRTIPLVMGLFVLSPPGLLGAYVVGAAAVIAVRDRLSRLKLIFNVALLMLEVAAALTVFKAFIGPAEVRDPQAWIAAILAAIAVDLLGGVLVSVAIWLHQGRFEVESIGWLAISGAFAAAANACFALVAVLLASFAPAAVVLLIGIAVLMFVAYRAYASLRQRHSELEVLQEYTTALGQTVAFEDVALGALREARDRLEADRAELWFLTPSGNATGIRVALDGDEPPAIDHRYPIPLTDPLWGRLVSSVPAVVISRNDRDPSARALLEQYTCKDLVAAPLRGERGLVGILLLRDRLGDVGTFDVADGRLLSALSRYTSIALENGRLVDELQSEASRREYEALHDQLTELPNRRCFFERGLQFLDHTATDHIAAVLLLAFDDFREIVDTFGHASGDAVLIEAASRLSEAVAAPATVARLGGDEFAILLPELSSAHEAVQLAARIREALGRPQLVNGVTVHLDTNAGIALFPAHGTDMATLLRCADVAMCEAKEQRMAVCVYSAPQDSHTPERLALAADLRAALADGSFALGYQPIKSLATDRIIGVEVLARWEHPTRGLLPPPTYIAVAEQSDLIRLLTGYVLQHALEQRRSWLASGLDLTISVNVSVHDLHREGFATDVARLLATTGTPPGRLILELTETQARHHSERIAPVLSELQSRGVLIAIDDFGTGYSSLTSLRSLPVDEIKIDKSFVTTMTANEHDNAIVGAIIDLARRLGIDIVAEGVEDEETERQLRELGCNSIQGYLLTPALPSDELEHWLGRRAPDMINGATIVPLSSARPTHSRVHRADWAGTGMQDSSAHHDSNVSPVGNPALRR